MLLHISPFEHNYTLLASHCHQLILQIHHMLVVHQSVRMHHYSSAYTSLHLFCLIMKHICCNFRMLAHNFFHCPTLVLTPTFILMLLEIVPHTQIVSSTRKRFTIICFILYSNMYNLPKLY